MTAKNLKPLYVLVGICLIVAALLAGINVFTAKVIEQRQNQAIQESLATVAPDPDNVSFKPVDRPETAPAGVGEIYKDEISGAYAVTVKRQGYKSVISMTVGVGADGKIIKVVITDEQESHGKAEFATFPDRFAGKGADEIEDVEAITSATVSSNAVKAGVTDALVALGFAQPEAELPRTEAELIGYAKQLIDGAEDFENITPKGEDGLVKRIYEETSGKGYVMYTHTYAQYGGGLETETLIAVNPEGTITNIKNLTWVVGHSTEYGPPPPSADTVNEFFERFIGKNASDIGSVELITNATGTANNVRVALTEALDMLPDSNRVPRITGIVIFALAVLGAAAAVIVSKKMRRVK